MSAPLTILHLTHEGHGAGSSISIALLARAQLAAGHRVMVGCPPGTWLERLLRGSGVAHAPIAFTSIREATFVIERVAVLAHVDIINAHSSRDRAAMRRLRFQRRLRTALVMTRRGMPMSTLVSGLMSGFAADRTIAVSRPVRQALIRRGTPPWRISVVPNAVDLERIDRVVTEEEREAVREVLGDRRPETGDRPVIGVVSRRKDHNTLMMAMERVRTPTTLCSLGFVADPTVYRLPSTVPHKVIFLPFQNDPRPFYDQFDICVLPTRHEGMSQGILEAMALGKAVVTTRSGGNTDLIEDGVHGLLVPPLDSVALGAALERLLGDPALRQRLGAAARERARSEFTIARTLAGTDAAYQAALGR